MSRLFSHVSWGLTTPRETLSQITNTCASPAKADPHASLRQPDVSVVHHEGAHQRGKASGGRLPARGQHVPQALSFELRCLAATEGRADSSRGARPLLELINA